MNEAELIALRMGLHEAVRLDMHNRIVEGDSFSVLRWASGSWKPPWCLADMAEEVLELSSKMVVAFSLVKQSTYEVADGLTKVLW